MNYEAVTAIATALTALFVVIVSLYVEYSRRRHEAQKAHFEDIKKIVFEYIHGLLADYYLRILNFQDGFLEVASEAVSSPAKRSTEQVHHWEPVLHIKPPAHSLARTLGDSTAAQQHEEQFHHLYGDVKTRHFPQVATRWEQFVEQFNCLAQRCLASAEETATKLEERMKIPDRNEYVQQERWVNYLQLSVFLCGRLWSTHPGVLGTYQEGDHWIMNWFGDRVAQGTKEELEKCQAEVDKILEEQKIPFETFIQQAEVLSSQAVKLKQELEQLVLQRTLPGKCHYSQVPYL